MRRDPNAIAIIVTIAYALVFLVLVPEFSIVPHFFKSILLSSVYAVPHITMLMLSYAGFSDGLISLVLLIELVGFFALARIILSRQMKSDND